VDLFEYQARDLFEKHGVPVLAGAVATTADEAFAAASKMGGKVVVKAQVKVGGRGKAGGVKLAVDANDAKEKAGAILGMDIKGHTVHKVMIAQAAPIVDEYYMSILLDRSNRTFLVMASVAGGMDIEEVAHTAPEKLAKVPVTAVDGISLAKAKEIVAQAKFPADIADQVADVLVKLWETFQSEDATLVEINPLVKTEDGRIIALDGKVTLDDNAEFRQPTHEALVDHDAANALEAAAKEKGLNYVMADGLSIILGDPDVKSVFVNVFGGITACDAVANGIVQALELLGAKATKPIVVRLDGNNVLEGRAILKAANHPLIEQAETMDGAASRAAELAAK